MFLYRADAKSAARRGDEEGAGEEGRQEAVTPTRATSALVLAGYAGAGGRVGRLLAGRSVGGRPLPRAGGCGGGRPWVLWREGHRRWATTAAPRPAAHRPRGPPSTRSAGPGTCALPTPAACRSGRCGWRSRWPPAGGSSPGSPAGGWRLAFPLVFVAFALPQPDSVLRPIQGKLQSATTDASEAALRAFGYAVTRPPVGYVPRAAGRRVGCRRGVQRGESADSAHRGGGVPGLLAAVRGGSRRAAW